MQEVAGSRRSVLGGGYCLSPVFTVALGDVFPATQCGPLHEHLHQRTGRARLRHLSGGCSSTCELLGQDGILDYESTGLHRELPAKKGVGNGQTPELSTLCEHTSSRPAKGKAVSGKRETSTVRSAASFDDRF